MKLVLLVEGAQTEPKVYRSWLEHCLPELQRVPNVADLTTDGYVLVSGKGYPACFNRIAALLRDIEDHPGAVDEFWLCLDSDEDSRAARESKAHAAIRERLEGTKLAQRDPPLKVRVLVQHCCIETWFLGHTGMLAPEPKSTELAGYKQFFDVGTRDPEQMQAQRGYVTRQSFHLAYLRAMMAEQGGSYSKTNPGVVLRSSYFDALRERFVMTSHIPSFGELIEALREVGAAI